MAVRRLVAEAADPRLRAVAAGSSTPPPSTSMGCPRSPCRAGSRQRACRLGCRSAATTSPNRRCSPSRTPTSRRPSGTGVVQRCRENRRLTGSPRTPARRSVRKAWCPRSRETIHLRGLVRSVLLPVLCPVARSILVDLNGGSGRARNGPCRPAKHRTRSGPRRNGGDVACDPSATLVDLAVCFRGVKICVANLLVLSSLFRGNIRSGLRGCTGCRQERQSQNCDHRTCHDFAPFILRCLVNVAYRLG